MGDLQPGFGVQGLTATVSISGVVMKGCIEAETPEPLGVGALPVYENRDSDLDE